jgi:3-oxoacyl-[acyl-carrier-protein] synthase II
MSQYQSRVAVTGMGAICSLDQTVNGIWDQLIEGKSGITSIRVSPIDTAPLPVKIAGEVKEFSISEDLLLPREASRYDRFILFALHSAQEALEDAGFSKSFPYDPYRMGSILGVGMGGMPIFEKTHRNFLEKGYRKISPFFIPSIIPNMSTGIIGLKYGFCGVNFSLSSACASAGHSITQSCYEIMSNRQDLIVTGGTESVISNLPLGGFTNMKALSKKNDNPEKASRPFDKNRDGFVMGEGAGLLVLENLEKAKARGARIYAEIVGHGTTSDAYHITAPHPEGLGASKCMQMALTSAGLRPEMIDYINAHGTSTPLGDLAETKAIKKTFLKHSEKISISSTKSMTGHLLGAASGIESIFSVLALHHGIIPPTINLETPDPECDLDYTPNFSKKLDLKYAINNSFGFGGTNSSIIFKKYCP